MKKEFVKLREKYGLGDSPLHSSDESDEINNAAFRELRPKFKQKLKDFLLNQKKANVMSSWSMKSK